MINPDRLTVKSTEALNDALGHARKNGNPLVYDLHLLHALLSQEESIVVPILPAAVVLNKIELDPASEEVLARRFKKAGYQLLATSVVAEEGLAALRDLLRGRHSVFTGASGAGKSSLLNALEPGLKLRVGAISEKWRTGKHTTTAAELVPIAGVGYVVDTPGLREVGAWGIAPEALGSCFPEFRPYLDQCRFDNCRHLAEPGCAVRAAPPESIDPDRLASYARIYEEVIEPSWTSGRRRGR